MKPIFKSITNKAPLFRISSCLYFSLLFANSYAQENDLPLEITEPKLEANSSPEPKKQDPKQSRITLTNGDKLIGNPININDDNHLSFSSQNLHDKAKFPLEKVLTLNLDTWAPSTQKKTLARVQIQPSFRSPQGDTLTGELQALTPDNIEIKTEHAGVINIKRSMTKSLDIINQGKGSYYGPNDIQEWSLPFGKHTWEFNNGTLISNEASSIGQDLELTEKAHLSFQASWQQTMRFNIQLYSNDVTEVSPTSYYDIYLNRNNVSLQTRGKGHPAGHRASQRISAPLPGLQNQFDIFMNRKRGLFIIYINGEQACTMRSPNPDPEDLGTGLSFKAYEADPIKISQIHLRPWNGITLPDSSTFLSKDNVEKKDSDEKKPPHYIVLQNGDEVPGTAGKVEDGRIIVETEHTPIRIPIERVQSLRQSDAEEQPKKYAQDIRAWFHGGGHVTLRLSAFENETITGYNQAYGEVSFDIEAFRKIDFHIYDQTYNQLRNKYN